jgi:hypothetical protein
MPAVLPDGESQRARCAGDKLLREIFDGEDRPSTGVCVGGRPLILVPTRKVSLAFFM